MNRIKTFVSSILIEDLAKSRVTYILKEEQMDGESAWLW
jgi:hypothetical protein